MRRSLSLYFSIFSLLPGPVLPDAPDVASQRISGDLLTENAGLSSHEVTDILQDSLGFLWVATLDGLNKYDGYTFDVFR